MSHFLGPWIANPLPSPINFMLTREHSIHPDSPQDWAPEKEARLPLTSTDMTPCDLAGPPEATTSKVAVMKSYAHCGMLHSTKEHRGCVTSFLGEWEWQGHYSEDSPLEQRRHWGSHSKSSAVPYAITQNIRGVVGLDVAFTDNEDQPLSSPSRKTLL